MSHHLESRPEKSHLQPLGFLGIEPGAIQPEWVETPLVELMPQRGPQRSSDRATHHKTKGSADDFADPAHARPRRERLPMQERPPLSGPKNQTAMAGQLIASRSVSGWVSSVRVAMAV
jgi:hypothetical protein